MNQGSYRSSSNALKSFHEQLLCKKKQKKKPNKESSECRLPSISHKHSGHVRDQQRNRLHKKIQQMERRLKQYQRQNQIENQVKERFGKMMEKYSSNQNERGFPMPQYQSNYNHPLQLIYPGGQYPPMSSLPMQNLPSFNNGPIPNKKAKIPMNRKMIRKFRVAVMAVFFCKIFPRYSRKVTQIRYKNFKDKIKLQPPLVLKQKLFKGLKEQIKKIIRTNNQQFFKKTDYMSFKEDQSNSLTVFMHLESVIAYESKMIEKLMTFIQSEKFTKFVGYFLYSLPYQFLPDFIFTKKQVSHLNIHPTKGYSKAPKQASKYLILKKLFEEIIVNTNLILFVEEQLKDEGETKIASNDSIQFSLKQQMLKVLIQNHSEPLQNSLRTYLLPSSQIAPGFKQKKHELRKKLSETQQKDIEMDEIDTDQFDEEQASLAEQFTLTLQKSIDIIYARAHQMSQDYLKQAKKQALQSSFNKIGDDHIYIRSHKSLELSANSDEVSEISENDSNSSKNSSDESVSEEQSSEDSDSDGTQENDKNKG